MKKILLFTLGMLFISQVQANNFNASQVQDYLKTSQVETVSDAYSNATTCESERTRFNREYPSYTRSECFLNNAQYFYFICGSEYSCNLANISELQKQTSQTTNTNLDNSTPQIANLSLNTNINIPNKSKLDTFLKNVQKKGESFNDDAKYDRFLEALEKQLTSLKNKYSKNTTIQNMTNYLISGVENIRVQKSQNQALLAEKSEIDKFFCELAGDCSDDAKSQTGNISTGSVNPPVISTPVQSTEFKLNSSSMSVRKDMINVNFAFNTNVGTKNIVLRYFNDKEYYETNLKEYNNGQLRNAGFEFSTKGSPHFPKMKVTQGAQYRFEIVNLDTNQVMLQYDLKLTGDDFIKVTPNTEIKTDISHLKEASIQVESPKDMMCMQVITYAQNSQTGVCETFRNSCIPAGYKKVDNCNSYNQILK